MSNSSPHTMQNNTRQYAETIRFDKTVLVYKNIPFILLANFIGPLPVATAIWADDTQFRVVAWLGLLYIISLVRLGHYLTFKLEQSSMQDTFRFGKVFAVLSMLAGCSWGLAGALFFNPDEVAIYTFLLLTYVGIISGSMNSLSSKPLYYTFFSIPVMSPLIIAMFMQGSTFYYLMGGVAFVYLIITMGFSRNLHSNIHESLSLKYQNIDLVESLKLQTAIANKANTEKSRFLASASHDLRQPLHAVNLFVEVLENNIKDEQQRSSLLHVRRGLDSMGELFDSLLDISRIDAEDIQIEKTHFLLEPLVDKLINQFQLDVPEERVRLQLHSCHQQVHTDPVLLERILSNLLSNAVRYTIKGTIEVYCRHVSEKTLRIHLKDTGIGINHEDAENIFEEFTQLNNPERDRSKGLGLGLAIVRRLSALLELPLDMTSVVNEGTEFTLDIPISSENISADMPVLRQPADAQLQGRSIMVVDNDLEVLEAMQCLLQTWGCEVIIKESSQEALRYLEQGGQPDFIVSDYRMPGEMNGIELLSTIRSQYSGLPGLIVSGDTGRDIIAAAKQYDLTLIHKPIQPFELKIHIQNTLKSRG